MQVLILEDEPAAARKLRRLLEADGRITGIAGELDSIEAALQWISSHPRPDIIFSDIELADGLSFEVFRQWPDCPPIVFVSAYDQYALQAFQSPGVDYLLKPVKAEELKRALDKFMALTGKSKAVDLDVLRQAFEQLNSAVAPKRFLVRFGEKLVALQAADAAYYMVDGRVVFYMAKDGKRYPLDLSLEEVENLLDPAVFFRINRQFIVQVSAIRNMHVVSKSRVKLDLHPPHPGDTIVSKEKSPLFRVWIQGK
ncbi:MAG: response regulator [Bacteroidetes bacterium]|nr:response regulator [Bacteroidota bacterium]